VDSPQRDITSIRKNQHSEQERAGIEQVKNGCSQNRSPEGGEMRGIEILKLENRVDFKIEESND